MNHSSDGHPIATVETVRHLASEGVLDATALERSLEIIGHIPNKARWQRFIDLLLLVLGGWLLLAGIFFFFAYNWQDLSSFTKFGSIEVLIVVAIAVAFFKGLDSASGKGALAVATILIGVLLAVFGQVYQTGADSYQLFFTWAFLAVGWVIIGRIAPLWLGWLGLAQVALILYWMQRVDDRYSWLFMLLFAINFAALLYWEVRHWRQPSQRWWPRIAAITSLGAVLLPSLAFIFDNYRTNGDAQRPLIFLLYIVFTVAAFFWYSFQHEDMPILALIILGIIITVTSLLIEFFDVDNAFVALLFGFVVMIQAALAVRWLRMVSDRWEVAA